MRQIASNNMKPEIAVRKLVHSLGYRYRLHKKGLPGKPDLVLRSRRAIVFVHGCFWHQHPNEKCLDARMPQSNRDYWVPKLTRNVERDAINIRALQALGWRVLVVWECEVKNAKKLANRLDKFLDQTHAQERRGQDRLMSARVGCPRYEAHLSSDVPRLMRLLTSAHPTIVYMEDNRRPNIYLSWCAS